ncbi:MAG: DnaJ domain-containing protein [Luteolibacter sp.]
MNPYELLSLPQRLVISEDELREAFREAGKTAHPDAGGGEAEFAAIREAQAILASPSKRLKLWLELRGLAAVPRGTIGNALMDLFSEVGRVTQQAETLIRKRDEAKSVLVRAMLEGETQVCREAVEEAIARVDAEIARECGVFPELETAETLDLEEISRISRDLAFLEKWKAGLRACYARLV